jgi:hypothetical protein
LVIHYVSVGVNASFIWCIFNFAYIIYK